MTDHVAAVVIGRNEGARLIECLTSLKTQGVRIVYVDSGSTDGSVAAAEALGAQVVSLDMAQPFTAARARNAGLEALQGGDDRLVQFIDGDCELREGWIEAASAFLETHPDVVAVCGRRRERHPEASLYNRLIDLEWATPVGEARSCGGDALMRIAALEDVGGFNPHMIAGEEPELCVRLRQNGGRIWRIDAEMTWHDADLTRFAQWWKRAKRAGHAYAEGAALHGAPPERHNVAQTRRAMIWGLGTVFVAIMGILVWWPLLLGLALIWAAQILRLFLRSGNLAQSGFFTLSKLPECIGALGYYRARLTGQRQKLIEYK